MLHVTLGAPDLLVGRSLLLYLLYRVLMTTRAQSRGNIAIKLDCFWHVGLVTAKAILIDHFLCMGFMTFHALCGLTVGRVTLFTVQSSMFARVGLHFFALFRVAGQTCGLHMVYFRKVDLQRRVGGVAR